MQKALIPIEREDVTEQGFDKYDFFFKINTNNYEHCTCWLEYIKKKKVYANWLIRIPMNEIKYFIQN